MWYGRLCSRTSGMTRLHLAICSHLWTSSYYQKQQHFRSCATSALILCSFLHVGATSRRAPCISRGLRAGISGLHGALALGPLPQAELRAPMAALPIRPQLPSRWPTGRRASSCMAWIAPLCIMSFSATGPVGLLGGLRFRSRPPPEIMFLDVTVCADCTVPFIVPNAPIRSCSPEQVQ